METKIEKKTAENLLNNRLLVVPLVTFAVLVLSFYLLFKLGLDRLSQERERLAQTLAEEKVLVDKEALLSSLQGKITQSANNSVFALPNQNPAILFYVHIKNMAAEKGIILQNVSINAPEDSDDELLNASVTLEMIGPLPQIMDLMDSISEISPIAQVGSVNLDDNDGTYEASVLIKIYWSSLPQNIPQITDPIAALSPDENELINKINLLEKPTFTEVSPLPPGSRSDPFNL